MAKHEFQTEITELLNLMIHSLYSNKEIFLRELISNSSDALDKLKYLTLTDEKFKEYEYEPKITIKFNKDEKTLTVIDNGIGMDEIELKNNLGTIAKSGTKSFLSTLKEDSKKQSELIGQFGVGFYSTFMVAKKVEVFTKKAGTSTAYKWSSDATGSYEIEQIEKADNGTEIVLHLKDEEDEFLSDYRIESIVGKYSNHIPFPIFLEKEEEKDGKKEIKLEQINKASALWRVGKSELKDEDYNNFYKQTFHDSEDPILHIHTKAEGNIEYTTLFFIPQKAPFDLYRVDYQSGVKLYVKRVFISDDDKELLPTYLRFVRGIFDVEDLPLNVSREILQENIILTKVKKASVKKILNELKKLKNKDFDKYKELYKEFGRVLKEGIMSEFENRELLLELLLFKTNKSKELIDLDTYIKNMKDEQKEILYLIGEDYAHLKNSPHLEEFNEKGIEVLLMDDEVDSIVIPQIGSFKEKSFKSASEVDSDEKDIEKLKEEYANLTVKLKEELKDEVKDVKLTNRLKTSPACLVFDKNDPDFMMQQMMKQMGQTELPPIKPILEINPHHDIFTKLKDGNDLAKIKEVSSIVLDLAKLNEGMKLDDLSEFTKKVSDLLTKSL